MPALKLSTALARYTIRNVSFLITDGTVLFSRIVTGPSHLPRG